MDRRDMARTIWQAGVDAVGGYAATAAALAETQRPDRILAVGKAAGAMARAALDRFGAVPCLVVTKDGHGDGLPGHVQLIEASHPVPDARSLQGGQALREAVEAMEPGTHLLLLVSGGASSLAEDLMPGKTLDDLAALNRRLLAAGLDITAMNAERRGISRIKGGGLLSGFQGAEAVVLAISDVPGDDLMVIGSGIGALPDGLSFRARARIIASNAHARAAAAQAAETAGYAVLANEEALHDDLPALAARLGPRLRDMPRGAMILGGEPTVILPENPGRGGRNQALALALAHEIAGCGGITLVVGGTDGTDGPTDAAGAIVDGSTWGDGAAEALSAADSGSYLDRKGALLVTGPTGTNVMDLLVAIRE
ncbi:DUF4147 domain-containing protein [Ruegeria sediminis]|uniref:DUF4147 domain-containing protein n=1 Tax=Ruegeria sediminis TaxID=2583820 RepID=A0ABY2WY62_9RHOB|nr:DUF4147 domain-containing protein [Ruegeria sediminis]TMV07810.1 DUF4147 domain-containing protein [Ruegeria sediminis]